MLALVSVPIHAGSVGNALQGAAGIAGAAASIGAAAAAASADREVAKIEAEAQMYQTDAANKNNLILATIDAGTRLAFETMKAKVASFAELQKTLRLDMTLKATEKANDQKYAFNLLQMQNDFFLKFQALGLQAKAMDQQFAANLAAAKAGGGAAQPTGTGFTQPTSAGVDRFDVVTGATSPSASDRLLANVQAPQSTQAPLGGAPLNGLAVGTARGFVSVASPARTLNVGRGLASTDFVRHIPRGFTQSAPTPVPTGSNHAHAPRDL